MTKDCVLAILRQENNYLSGEVISRSLGVSRAAVNTAVKSLREDGYIILSATNKGYLLTDAPDRISIGELMPHLPADRTDRILCLGSVNSTNKYLYDLAYEGAPHGQAVFASEQTDGKGRSGSCFFSPKEQGIYLSYLIRPDCLNSGSPQQESTPYHPDYFSDLPKWAAVSTSDAIEQTCGVRPQINGINDLLLHGKKLCGILTELSMESETAQVQSVVIGIGIHITEQKTDFPKEIRSKTTSLSMELKQPLPRAPLAAALINALDRMCLDYPQEKNRYQSLYQKNHIALS